MKTNSVVIPEFVIGNAYNRRDEITGSFGGSGQSGIAPSNKTPAVFLFTGSTGKKYGYSDIFDELGCLLYTGEGQVGDMTLTKGNLAIAEHAIDGRALHVFEATGHSKPYIYKGEFSYGAHFKRRGLDRNGDERDVLVFRLVPVSSTLQIELSEGNDGSYSSVASALRNEISLKQQRILALTACQVQAPNENPSETVRLIFKRSNQVKRYVLARANGHCELCEAEAPFLRKRDNSPYLEPHHINRLSDGGLDHPLHVGAICPSCHRQIHFGTGGEVLNENLRAKVKAMEKRVQESVDD